MLNTRLTYVKKATTIVQVATSAICPMIWPTLSWMISISILMAVYAAQTRLLKLVEEEEEWMSSIP